MKVTTYTTQEISELEFPDADQEGYDSIKWVLYGDHLVFAEQEHDEGYEKGDIDGYDRGYEDGVDSVSKLPLKAGSIIDSFEACKESFLKMRDREPTRDEYAIWLENDASNQFWG